MAGAIWPARIAIFGFPFSSEITRQSLHKFDESRFIADRIEKLIQINRARSRHYYDLLLKY